MRIEMARQFVNYLSEKNQKLPEYKFGSDRKFGDVVWSLTILNTSATIEGFVIASDNTIDANEFLHSTEWAHFGNTPDYHKGLVRRPLFQINVNGLSRNLEDFVFYNHEPFMCYEDDTINQPYMRLTFDSLEDVVLTQYMLIPFIVENPQVLIDAQYRANTDFDYEEGVRFSKKISLQDYEPQVTLKDAKAIEGVVRRLVSILSRDIDWIQVLKDKELQANRSAQKEAHDVNDCAC